MDYDDRAKCCGHPEYEILDGVVPTSADQCLNLVGRHSGRRFPLCGWHRHELDGHQRRDDQSPSPANTGVAVASNTRYKFRIRVDSGNGVVYFSVNDSTEVSLNVNLPATTQNLGYALYALTNTAAGKELPVQPRHVPF